MRSVTTFLAVVLSVVVAAQSLHAAAFKPRLVVLTDIAPGDREPDDQESLVRLLVYADRFEIEGLIACSGWNNSGHAYPVAWLEILKGTVDAYEKDLPNLMKRSGQTNFLSPDAESKPQELGYWPSPAYLRSVTMLGSLKLGFKQLGATNHSAGSDFLIRLADEDDARPIYVAVWGGANTFAQAVWRVQKERTPEQLKSFLRKFRVFTITDQDKDWGANVPFEISSHQWLRREFADDLMFIWDESAWLYQCDAGKKNWSQYETEIQGRGNLGKIYPKYKYGVEGDTPSFLYVLPNGLNNPEQPGFGGWGGFFARGIGADKVTSAYVNQAGESANGVSRKYETYFYLATFNDFAARMSWAERGTGNRNPLVVINGDASLAPVIVSAAPGSSVTLDASATSDPDGDQLAFKWWVLPEAGSYQPAVTLTNTNSSQITVTVPSDAAGKSFHVICEVTDKGTPNLTSYRRVIFEPLAAGLAAKIKLLIIEGVSNHDWQHRLALVREILARDGSFDVTVSTTPSAPDDPAWATWRPDFSKYDVVLSGYNNLGGKAQWPKEVQQAFEKYVRGGGGFYVYHEANNSFAEWPEYNQMIGLGWRKKDFGSAIIVRPDESLQIVPSGEGNNTGHGNRSDVVVHQLGEHPIHAGLPRAWKAADIEVYCYARGPATNLTLLAYAADAQTQVQFPVEWTVQYGEGRVFVSTYGHVWADQKDPKGMKCAAFQTIMVRALKWLAKRPVDEGAPADFPTADAVSLRQW